MRSAVDLLLELRQACADGRAPSAAAAAWFVDGVARAEARGEWLDQSLGLAGPGRRSLQRRLAARVRDQHLIAAARAVVVDPETSTRWEQAMRLAPLAARFADDWPTVRRLAAPPADWPAWKRHLFFAAQTDLPLPRSARHVARLLGTRTPGFSCLNGLADDARP